MRDKWVLPRNAKYVVRRFFSAYKNAPFRVLFVFAEKRGVSVLTEPVSQLDSLFRFTHKLSQSGFESSRNMLPACYFFSAQ